VEAGAPAHTMLLWALEGAILDVDWRDLPADRREHLREEGKRLTQGYSGRRS
jgi:TfoX C-terminal domain